MDELLNRLRKLLGDNPVARIVFSADHDGEAVAELIAFVEATQKQHPPRQRSA